MPNSSPRPRQTLGSGRSFARPAPTRRFVDRRPPVGSPARPSAYPSSSRTDSPSRGTSRGGYSGSRRPAPRRGGGYSGGGGRGGKRDRPIDISRFINKAVVTETAEVFVPEHRFADFAVDERLKRAIAAKGYDVPTPIQDRAVPRVLEGLDVVGIANTGTGKTAAFLIPLIHKTLKHPKERVLIMAPTRELAIQIEDEFRGFVRGLGLFSVCAVGGANIGPQLGGLRRNPAFVIGTPGRIKDLMERRALDLSGFASVVLDEADRMLDMGFIEDMKFIMGQMPEERQTLFFSATVSPEIKSLIGKFLRSPITISVKTQETSGNVEQDVVRVPAGKTKLDVLEGLLREPGFDRVLIFGRTKHGVEQLARSLARAGFRAESIHGNKSHSQRQRALGAFREGRVQVLTATDVAARGLDIRDVTHVINFELPGTYEDYVHRIGRTGRGTKKGKALTFV